MDDELDNTLVFSIGLEDNGFAVDSFTDPILALSNFKSDSYDILILDIKMPKMNGYELYEKVSNMDDKVKVCFLTAYGEHYTEEFKSRFASMDSSSPSSLGHNIFFIRKPVQLDELVKKVNETIKKR